MMFQARQATSSKPGTTTAAHPGHPLNMMAVPMQPHSQTQPPLPPQQQQQHQQQQRMVAVPAASMPVVPAKMHATGTGISTSTGYVSQQAMQVVSAPAAMHSRLPTRACTAGVTSQRTISPKMAPSRQPPLVKTSTNTHPQLPGPHQLPTQMQPVPAPTLASTLSSGGSTMHSGLCNTPQVVQAPSLHQTGSRPILLGNRAQLQPQQQPQQQLKHSRRQRQAAKSLTSDVRRSQGNSVPRSFVPSVGLIYHPSQLPGRGGATLTATATSNSNGLPTPAAASAVAAAAPGPVALVPIARGHSPMPAWVAYPAVVPIASPRIRLRRPSVGAPVHVAQAPGPLIAKHQQLSQQPQQLQQQLQQQPHQHQQQQQQQQQQQPQGARPLPAVGVVQLCPEDLEAWHQAACNFEMNTDFDISGPRCFDLASLVATMKAQSAGKRTIQALADKLTLHQLLENMGIVQMPVLLAIEGVAEKSAVDEVLRENLCKDDAMPLVAKPTHQSNATGVLILSRPQDHEVDSCVEYVTAHMQKHMTQKAGEHESAALRSLRPGYLIQPKYESVVGFKSPLELRVVVLWGNAYIACWWWGRNASPSEVPHRNAWLVRQPAKRGAISEEDSWVLAHDHPGGNVGHDKAMELFQLHIREMADSAERVARAVGAPFLRTDFFVGSERWGVRLNEVAYGCGCDYRVLGLEGIPGLLDAGPAMAQILQDGMGLARRFPSQHFLTRLGVQGSTYEDLSISELPLEQRPKICSDLKESKMLPRGDPSICRDYLVPEDLCQTPKNVNVEVEAIVN